MPQPLHMISDCWSVVIEVALMKPPTVTLETTEDRNNSQLWELGQKKAVQCLLMGELEERETR